MFPRLQRACFHPPSKLGGIQQAFFIKPNTNLKTKQQLLLEMEELQTRLDATERRL
jgi:hypothetical protein